MKKIRINELARELEVKAHEILDRLPELGVTEKKTHSSSIDEDVALKLRRYYGFDAPEPGPDDSFDDSVEDGHQDRDEPEKASPLRPARGPAPPAPAAAQVTEPAASREEKPPADEAVRPAPAVPSHAPIRPPLGSGRPVLPPIGGARPDQPRVTPAPPPAAAPPSPHP